MSSASHEHQDPSSDSAERDQKPEGGRPSPAPKGVKSKKRSIVALSVVLVVLLCGVGAGVGYIFWQQSEMDRAAQQVKDTPLPVVDKPADEAPAAPVDNPVDFDALKRENPDIYAWIYVPNTDVNLPVLQSSGDDNYYLNHNRDKDYAVEGAIYSQKANKTDFSDPVTVLYGHNLVNGSMFSTLHNFEDPDFFKANDTMYVYTPGHVLTYRIVAAYLYDDRHILNSYDFKSPAVRESYFDTILHPDAMLANVRPGADLPADDDVLQLSTCMSDREETSSRYIVTGVLLDDQATK